MRWFSGKGKAKSSTVHVVYDQGGGGRLVGVFEDAERAAAIAAVNPGYYRLTSVPTNVLTNAALDWAAPDIRQELERLR